MTSIDTPAESPAETPTASTPVMLYPDSESLPGVPTRRNPLSAMKITLLIADLLMVSIALALGTWINEWVNPGDPIVSFAQLPIVDGGGGQFLSLSFFCSQEGDRFGLFFVRPTAKLALFFEIFEKVSN